MTNPIQILHIDDCPFAYDRLRTDALKHRPAWQFSWCEDFAKALQVTRNGFDYILCDFDFGNRGCMTRDSLQILRQHFQPHGILALSQHEDPTTIRELLLMGFDHVANKSNPIELLISAIEEKAKKGSVTETATNSKYGGSFVGQIRARIPKLVASAIRSIHIYGESGTGKEVICDLFQEVIGNSKPFIKVNCAAIAPMLIQSELFGSEKGAFTGAHKSRRGLIEAAHGGFIFLDEVALLTPEAQASLLRTLENREVRRVGADHTRQVDVRVISATNICLEDLVREGKFRHDLWQRLSETIINVPNLRERSHEIASIIQSIMNAPDMRGFSISDAAIKLLSSLDWEDGNIRSLRNCLRAMTENHQKFWLTPNSIPKRFLQVDPMEIERSKTLPSPPSLQIKHDRLTDAMQSDCSLQELSNLALLQYLKALSTRHKLSTRRLASILRISRSTLSSRLNEMLESQIVTYAELQLILGSKYRTE